MASLGLIDRTYTCSDGTLRLVYTPQVSAGGPAPPSDMTQRGSWTIVTGTGAFEGIQGTGMMTIVYGADGSAPVHETVTGSVTHRQGSDPPQLAKPVT